MSLVELVVVLAIIGVLVGMALPGVARYRALEDAKSSTQTVAEALRNARSRALRTGISHIVLFNPDPNRPDQVARIVRDTDNSQTETTGDEVESVSLARVRANGVNPYGRNGVKPFTIGRLATGDPNQNGLASLGAVNDGTNFPAAKTGGGFGVGFNGRGMTFPLQNTAQVGQGGGAYYITDGNLAVFAAVVLPLGEVRVRTYDPTTNQWR